MSKRKTDEELKFRRQIRFSPGARFGRWTTIRRTPDRKGYVDCVCDCGVEKSVYYASITHGGVGSGYSTSCGCFQKEDLSERKTIHSMTESTEYIIWCGMKNRCFDSNNKSWKHYGQRGISVCAEWVESFEAFYGHVGPRPSSKHSIDRYPNKDGNYEPGNVRWANPKEQARNTRGNHLIIVDGMTKTLVEWQEESGLKKVTIDKRLKAGWDPVVAVMTPVGRFTRWNPHHGMV